MIPLLSLLLCVTSPGPQEPGVATAPVEVRAQTPMALAKGREIAQAIIAAGAPGLQVAVGQNGALLWSEAFGWADVGQQIPMRTTSRIRVGSTAKSMTAVGLARLVEDQSIDLDAAIQTYVPTFPEKPEGRITARLLGGNLSGIRHYQGMEFRSNRPYPSVTEGLSIFQDSPLVCAPGERFAYSTYGWSLLSAAMEAASGTEFLSYMDSRVFRPLGMNATGPDHAEVVLPGRASCYAQWAGNLVEQPPVNNSYKWAGGGFLSTAEDLVRLGAVMLRPGFLSQESITLLGTSQSTTAGEASGYGIGWFTAHEDGEHLLTHGGGSVGGTTFLLVHAKSGLVIALTTNMSRGPLGRARALEIWRLFR